MIKKANILIARNKDAYRIKVEGRATFECSAPVRNLVHNIAPEGARQVTIDLSACTGMDSTFMGVLAMAALRVRNLGSQVEVVGCSDANQYLLNGLGLKPLFLYRGADSVPMTEGGEGGWTAADEAASAREKAETVLDAHETLIAADGANRSKFGAVVKMVRDDLAKMGPAADTEKED
jgi:anti-anti-sigma regulatory factor